jgi:hypothetical protein
VTTRAQAAKKTKRIDPLKVAGIDIAVTPEELCKLQNEDPSLRRAKEACEAATTHPIKNGEMSYMRKGQVLMRKFVRNGIETFQVVVPTKLRTAVMTLAHDAPKAEHLASQHTADRILKRYYWPGMCGEIRRFCKSCAHCQKTMHKGCIPKVPLVQTPLIRTPFKQIGVATVIIEEELEWKRTMMIGRGIPDIPLTATETFKDVNTDSEDPALQKQIEKLVEEYADVSTDVPSCTGLEECKIKLTTERPVRTRQYPRPHSRREVIQQEVKAMLEMVSARLGNLMHPVLRLFFLPFAP